MIRPLLLALLTGCLPPFPDSRPEDSGTVAVPDADDDGFTVEEGDCDDANDAVYPNANERCNGIDDDCDHNVDDDAVDASLYFADADEDTFGDPYEPVRTCDAPAGHVSEAEDCDDSNGAIHPGADEVCDGVDNNCDNVTDDDAIDQATWYADVDDDAFGDDATAQAACDAPSVEHVTVGGDCDDLAVDTNPDGTEACGGGDEDCDTFVDDLDPDITGRPLWFPDADGDDYGDEDDPGVEACVQPAGTTSVQGDCDDGSAAYNPDASETDCTDPEDYNCDGSSGFVDNDGDNFSACQDCDDDNPGANPGEAEVCDPQNVDEDCDNGADDADSQGASAGQINTWPDVDLDGFGADGAAAVPRCDVVAGVSANDNDCDDGDADVSPADLELCDLADTDEDCDGDADDDDANPGGLNTFFRDDDGDGFGDPAQPTVQRCDAVVGLAAVDTDCDDTRGFVNPGAPEACDAVDRDEDCDSFGDDQDPEGAVVGTQSFYLDGDLDGFGDDDSARIGCDLVAPEIPVGGDCDDGDGSINPSAREMCDLVDTDEDCDGGADDQDQDGASGTVGFAPDADGDGFGDANSAPRVGCDAVGNEVADTTDCNDLAAEAYPGAIERCNGTHDDCSNGAWTDDNGIVTAERPAGIQDLTPDFNAGAVGAPAPVVLPSDAAIAICPGTYAVTLSASGTVDLVGFSGLAGDTVLSGEGVGQVLALAAGTTLSLTDLTITGGGATEGGGILVPATASLTATDCVFQGNTADDGGALHVRGVATLVSNDITSNTAGRGAGVFVDGGSVTGTSDALTDNAATTAGGAWFLMGGGDIDLTNVRTTDNTAPTGAGAQMEGGTLSCAGLAGSFIQNYAVVSGGGVELVAGTLESTVCDWSPGNGPDDVHTRVAPGYFFGINNTFFCDEVIGCL